MSAERTVLAFVAREPDGSLTRESAEVLGAASILAQAGWKALAACAGSQPLPAAALGGWGVATALQFGAVPSAPGADVVAAALEGISPRPTAFFLADTLFGREVAARLAAGLDCDLVTGCNSLQPIEAGLGLGREYLGGRASLEMTWSGEGTLVVTVAQGAFSAPRLADSAPARVEAVDCTVVDDRRLTRIAQIASSPDMLEVEEAEVIVAGGAGVGGEEGFRLLRELAARLGGTVAASRVAVDQGWAPRERQIGQTGKTVRPRLYIAFGISGAPQHIAGMKDAGKVLAVNRDRHAPIFDVADVAVVADLWKVLPCLLERLPARNGAKGE